MGNTWIYEGPTEGKAIFQHAATRPGLPPEYEADALFRLAYLHFQDFDPDAAIGLMAPIEDLVEDAARRTSIDCVLTQFLDATGRKEEAEAHAAAALARAQAVLDDEWVALTWVAAGVHSTRVPLQQRGQAILDSFDTSTATW